MKGLAYSGKRTVLIFISILYFASGSNGLTQDTTLFHFPLNLGDTWEYAHKTGTLVTTTTKTVVGDTTLQNNLTYMQIKEFNPQFGTRFQFLRVQDSLRVFTLLPNSPDPIDTLLFHLRLYNGKKWRSGLYSDTATLMLVDSVYQAEFFGRIRNAARIILPEITFGIIEFILVDSLGIFFVGFEGGTETLIGAIIDGIRYGTLTNIIIDSGSPPSAAFFLQQNYPNPFNSQTNIQYAQPKKGHVELTIFDLLGQKVSVLVNEVQPPGIYRIIWDGKNAARRDVPSGVYIYFLNAAGNIDVRKMSLLR